MHSLQKNVKRQAPQEAFFLTPARTAHNTRPRVPAFEDHPPPLLPDALARAVGSNLLCAGRMEGSRPASALVACTPPKHGIVSEFFTR